MRGSDRERYGRLGRARGQRGKRVAQLSRGVRAVVVVVVEIGLIAADVDEVAVLVDVLERVQQRFLPAGKKRDCEKSGC